jgi:serine/threonine-protein kinase RsbW
MMTDPINAFATNHCRERGTSRKWHFASLTRASEVRSLVKSILEAMAAEGYGPEDIFAMRLVLDEALANALTHGNQGDPSKQVCVRYLVRAKRVLADIQDEGTGFDTASVADPTAAENVDKLSGRGLFLVRRYANWVRHNKRGNRITICKRPSRLIPR